MKIDLSKEQGALVPLYFFRKPLGWPAEERPAAPDRRQTASADRRETEALNSLMKSRAQDTTRSARRSHQMALCAIKATPAWHPTAQACGAPAASALPTATCGYVGDPKGCGTAASTGH